MDDAKIPPFNVPDSSRGDRNKGDTYKAKPHTVTEMSRIPGVNTTILRYIGFALLFATNSYMDMRSAKIVDERFKQYESRQNEIGQANAEAIRAFREGQDFRINANKERINKNELDIDKINDYARGGEM